MSQGCAADRVAESTGETDRLRIVCLGLHELLPGKGLLQIVRAARLVEHPRATHPRSATGQAQERGLERP